MFTFPPLNLVEVLLVIAGLWCVCADTRKWYGKKWSGKCLSRRIFSDKFSEKSTWNILPRNCFLCWHSCFGSSRCCRNCTISFSVSYLDFSIPIPFSGYSVMKYWEQAGGPMLQIPTGRRDGRASVASVVRFNIIDTSFTMDEMMKLFSSKGLSLDDLVILSGNG